MLTHKIEKKNQLKKEQKIQLESTQVNLTNLSHEIEITL
jgi:hypothetical protein